jgi:hypothetical protein
MALITHIFKVGDANFTVTHDNGVLVIGDAGIGPNYPGDIFSTELGLNLPGFETFKKILQENQIHTIHTVISHQHTDHYNLLPALFQVVQQERIERQATLEKYQAVRSIHPNAILPEINQLEVGRFIIGGEDLGPGSNMNETLAKVNRALYQQEGSDEELPMLLNFEYVLSTPFENRTRRIYFKGEKNSPKRKYLKILFPQDASDLDPNNPNETSLVSMLVAKRTLINPVTNLPYINQENNRPIKQVQKTLLFGDATTPLQERLEAEQFAKHQANPLRHQQQIGPVDVVLLPHHLSGTGGQAAFAANIASGPLPWSHTIMVGSTTRVGNKLPPVFRDKDQLHSFFFTRDVPDGEAITTVMRPKINMPSVSVETLDSLSSKMPRPRIAGLRDSTFDPFYEKFIEEHMNDISGEIRPTAEQLKTLSDGHLLNILLHAGVDFQNGVSDGKETFGIDPEILDKKKRDIKETHGKINEIILKNYLRSNMFAGYYRDFVNYCANEMGIDGNMLDINQLKELPDHHLLSILKGGKANLQEHFNIDPEEIQEDLWNGELVKEKINEIILSNFLRLDQFNDPYLFFINNRDDNDDDLHINGNEQNVAQLKELSNDHLLSILNWAGIDLRGEFGFNPERIQEDLYDDEQVKEKIKEMALSNFLRLEVSHELYRGFVNDYFQVKGEEDVTNYKLDISPLAELSNAHLLSIIGDEEGEIEKHFGIYPKRIHINLLTDEHVKEKMQKIININ